MRRTTPGPTPPETADDAAAGPVAEGEGAGGPATPEAKKAGPRAARKPRKVENERMQGRKLVLSDRVFGRLQLLAIQRGTSASAIAEDLLDRNLPKLRIEREA